MGVALCYVNETPLFSLFLYLLGYTEIGFYIQCLSDKRRYLYRRDLLQGKRQVGSLAGAVHLSNVNVGVQKLTQCGQKPHIE